MCGKLSNRYTVGSKIIAVSVVLLLVVLSPLAAWPTWLGGSGNQAEQISLLEGALQEKEEKIQSLQGLIDQLDQQLTALMENSDGSTNTIEGQENLIASLKEQLTSLKQDQKNLQIAKEKAESELKMLKELYGLSEESYQEMKTDYDDMVAEYNEKADESAKYYQELVKMKAKVQESDGGNGFHGAFGTAVIYAPDGNSFGTEIEAGLGKNDMTFTVGIQYMFPDGGLSLDSLKPDKLTYKAGMQFRF